MSAGPRLLVIVPARDEEAVIERKLRNLARVAWPERAEGQRHQLCVVDDESRDATPALARRTFRELFADDPRIVTRVVVNEGPAGKDGAIATALRYAEPHDLVVLSDADVVLRYEALVALARAFAADPRLGLACGAQELCGALADDGRPTGPGGASPVPAADLYDRATAWVRRLESRRGRLFSVHGQLCAWRAGLDLEPTTGIAADDLELVFRARARGLRVRLVPGARFLEERRRGPDARAQAFRRAQAYHQAVRGQRDALGEGWLDRVQWFLYRTLPAAAPYLAAAGAAFLLVAAGALYGLPGLAGAAALLGGLFALPPGRRLARRLVAIARAGRAPLALGDRWDTLRS